jgi:1-acyl-sn-glycerol-3-phosphate acyltransferase
MSMKVERKKVDFDYSEYLGSDYKKNEQPKFVSTFISNHVSWSDIIVYIFQYQPAFAAKKELRSIPVFGLLC